MVMTAAMEGDAQSEVINIFFATNKLGCDNLSYLIPSSTILNPISIENILDIWDRVGSGHGWHDYFSRSSGISFIY